MMKIKNVYNFFDRKCMQQITQVICSKKHTLVVRVLLVNKNIKFKLFQTFLLRAGIPVLAVKIGKI